MQIAACSSSDEARLVAYNDSVVTAESRQREENKYLAYEHRITVDAQEKTLESRFNNVIQSCTNDKVNSCTILESSLNTDMYVSANIRIRIKPEGVKEVIAIATKDGEIINQSINSR